MYRNFKIVKIDSKYCNYLRKYDSRVPYNSGSKELRPFIGVLFTVEKHEYYAPLSSPKPKHKTLKNTIDLIKIKNGEYGVINLNNMIPVSKNNYELFDLNKKTKNNVEKSRINLMNNQLRWLNFHKKEIYTKSKLLYNLYKNNKLPQKVVDRCCDFPMLEKKMDNYNKKYVKIT